MGRRLIANIQRHEAKSTNRPPTKGPIIKAIPVQAVQLPMALACAAPAIELIIKAKELGTNKAPAIPCTARKMTKAVDEGARAQSSEAMPKPISPTVKMRRRPNKSDSDPAIKMRA